MGPISMNFDLEVDWTLEKNTVHFHENKTWRREIECKSLYGEAITSQIRYIEIYIYDLGK